MSPWGPPTHQHNTGNTDHLLVGCPRVLPDRMGRGRGGLLCYLKFSGVLHPMGKVVEVEILISSNNDSSFQLIC